MNLRISSGTPGASWPAEPDDLRSNPSDVEAAPTDPASDPEAGGLAFPPVEDPETSPVPVDDGPSTTDLYLRQQSLGLLTAEETVGGKLLRWLRGDSPPAPVSPADTTGVGGQEAPPTATAYPTTAAALQAGDPQAALQRLNGLSMTAMVRELDQLTPDERASLHPALHVGPNQYNDRGLPPVCLGTAEGVDGERIGYALCVVETHLLPVSNPGDLKATGQAKEAADFLAERVYLPVAKNVNRHAAPHLSRLLLALQEQGVTNPNHIAYVLASAQHESWMGGDMTENTDGKKYDGRADLGNTQPGDGPKFKGKGYIQLTGRANYEKYTRRYQVDLVNNPDLATDPDLAAKIAAHGMQNGTYTGAKLSWYDRPNGAFDFVEARRIVNGDVHAPSDPHNPNSEEMGIHVAKIAQQYRRKMHVS